MLAYAETKDPKWAAWLEKVNAYIYKYFCDAGAGNGEWFGYLNRDGSVFNRCKGGNYKGCFHVPRALLYSMKVAESVMRDGSGGEDGANVGVAAVGSGDAAAANTATRPASPQAVSSWGISHGHGASYGSATKDGHQAPRQSAVDAAGLQRNQAAAPWSPKSGAQALVASSPPANRLSSPVSSGYHQVKMHSSRAPLPDCFVLVCWLGQAGIFPSPFFLMQIIC